MRKQAPAAFTTKDIWLAIHADHAGGRNESAFATLRDTEEDVCGMAYMLGIPTVVDELVVESDASAAA